MNAHPPARPDVIWILTDQQSRWHGRRGLGPAATELAETGAFFDVCQCAAPVCGPSRASLFSGLPVHRHGLIYNDWGENFGKSEWENRGMLTAGQRFAEGGYDCQYFGKWHAGVFSPESADAIPGFRNDSAGISGRIGLGWDTDSIWTDRAINALHNRSSEPLFLVLSLHNPHDICYYILGLHPEIWSELQCQAGDLPTPPANFATPANELELAARLRRPPADPKRFGGREMYITRDWNDLRWREYLAVYRFLLNKADSEVGRFLEALNATQRGQEAFVAFTSDHGEGCAAHRMVAKQSPYRESMEVPFILRWKNHIPAGITESRVVADGLDLLPTSLAAAGLPVADLPGRAFEFLWNSNVPPPERDFSVSELYPALAEPGVVGRILRTPNLKYVFSTAKGGEEGASSPHEDPEETSLAINSGGRDQLREGRKLLANWMIWQNDPLAHTFSAFCKDRPLD